MIIGRQTIIGHVYKCIFLIVTQRYDVCLVEVKPDFELLFKCFALINF